MVDGTGRGYRSNFLYYQEFHPDSPQVLTRLRQLLDRGVSPIGVSGLKGSSKSFLLSLLWQQRKRNLLVITSTLSEAEECHRELLFFSGNSPFSLLLYPSGREGSLDPVPRDPELTGQRLAVLHHLLKNSYNTVVVAPVAALLKKVIPPQVLEKYAQCIAVGTVIDREKLITTLIKIGYLKVGIVEAPGDFSVRGGILDVFPPGYTRPLRIEFYSDLVDSIRSFDVVSQRSSGALTEAWIIPVSEAIVEEEQVPHLREYIEQTSLPLASREGVIVSLEQFQTRAGIERFLPYLYPSLVTFFDYFPQDGCLALYESYEVDEAGTRFLLTLEEQYQRYNGQGNSFPPLFESYLSSQESKMIMKRFQNLYLDEVIFSQAEGERLSLVTSSHESLHKELLRSKDPGGMLSPLVERIREWQEEGYFLLLVGHSLSGARKLIQLLEEYQVAAILSPQGYEELERERPSFPAVEVQVADFKRGFCFPLLRTVIITEREIFGEKTRREPPPKVKSGFLISDFSDLHIGDWVVHTDHGVGIYRGLRKLEVEGESRDYLVIEYLENDKLYVPIDRIKVVQKYVGTEGYVPRLDRLGGTSWRKTKKKVKDSIRAMARELLNLYASRKLLRGFAFSPVDRYYREFEETFPYEETPDQAAAIEEVMRDMGEPKPMDRLICGDVGYGKTEIALRSSFRAVMDGKQVAILVPTTVLAQQHYQTFCERLAPYPIRVEVLSRFRTRAEQRSILNQLREGKIDIIVGTHRLLQQDVHFKDLGLLVIDEEHRFGVVHKEKLKKMKKMVDVLTLTATPIPRTLFMSMAGIRDMSIISTPPEDRLAIETFIHRFDAAMIKEAIMRELRRGGQVFFVHDRVRSIPQMSRFLRELVPEAKLAIAHGQLSERQLEKVMLSFVKREVNLLLTTTIIESGLDFPSANTIIINRADRLGLAQLYQLRGRVGRSSYRAYCYLLIPGESLLSPEAKERLRALVEFSELGSGFKLSIRDLEIRGAGNILGASQSGHIAAVGLDLYTQLLEETIRELKGEVSMPVIDPEIHLPIPAFIPEPYIGDVNQRLVVYKRLALCLSDQEVNEIGEELQDRYGALPVEVRNLLEVIIFKNFLRKLMVSAVEYRGGKIVLTFHPQAADSLDRILTLLERDAPRCSFSPELKLSVVFPGHNWREVVDEVKKLLQ